MAVLLLIAMAAIYLLTPISQFVILLRKRRLLWAIAFVLISLGLPILAISIGDWFWPGAKNLLPPYTLLITTLALFIGLPIVLLLAAISVKPSQGASATE